MSERAPARRLAIWVVLDAWQCADVMATLPAQDLSVDLRAVTVRPTWGATVRTAPLGPAAWRSTTTYAFHACGIMRQRPAIMIAVARRDLRSGGIDGGWQPGQRSGSWPHTIAGSAMATLVRQARFRRLHLIAHTTRQRSSS